ncbi:MAG: hypothetical protein ACLR2E_03315 [Lachnospiraceae bacterium]
MHVPDQCPSRRLYGLQVRCSGRWGDRGFTGGQLLGGKTGNTFRAGLCLASLAEVKGKEYILVTAKAEDAGDAHVTDALKVYGQIGEQ